MELSVCHLQSTICYQGVAEQFEVDILEAWKLEMYVFEA